MAGAAGEETLHVALLVLVDQLEELFAWPKAEAEAFLRMIKILNDHPSNRIMFVATMRSDFQHRVPEFVTLEELTGRTEVRAPEEPERTLELGFPSLADLREMIVKPAEAAGLQFEVSEDRQRDLIQEIERDARPEAVPAVQLLLTELYNRKKDNLLTLAAYDLRDGVAGVMAKLGEEAFGAAGPAAQAAFPRIVRALVAQVSVDAPATARRTAEGTFSGDQEAAALVDELARRAWGTGHRRKASSAWWKPSSADSPNRDMARHHRTGGQVEPHAARLGELLQCRHRHQSVPGARQLRRCAVAPLVAHQACDTAFAQTRPVVHASQSNRRQSHFDLKRSARRRSASVSFAFS